MIREMYKLEEIVSKELKKQVNRQRDKIILKVRCKLMKC